eukprot:Tbor_TRINITY_DN5776_c2_g1::TRINITY_DN5776_c2_g1_i2::g.20784::m.20784
MSQLPSDPLAHISEASVSQESLRTIATHIVTNCLDKVYDEFTTGRHLVIHVALALAREENISAREYLQAINLGRRPFSDIYMFFGKLAAIMGPEEMGRKFATTYERLQARYQRAFQVSAATVAPLSPLPFLDASVGRNLRYEDEDF